MVKYTPKDKKNIPSWMCDLLLKEPPSISTSVDAPDTYTGQLHNHQKEALSFAMAKKRAMLALDCGLGKTHVGMAYMLHHLPSVVICPASLKSSWEEHILSYAPSTVDQIKIVSYNKMEGFKGMKSIVVDEAHYLKHESSQRSKTFMDILARYNPRVLLMTGTPAQRNSDLYHLLKILDPVHFKYFYHYGHSKREDVLYFADRYTVPQPVWIGGTRHGFKFTRNKNTEELALICSHYMLRMKKEDVADLPELQTTPVSVGKTDRPTYYQKKWSEIEEIRQTQGNRKADVELLALCRETSNEKLLLTSSYILSWVHKHPGEKIIVFYHHKDIGNQLEREIGSDISVRIDGLTPMKKRVERIHIFKEDEKCSVGILSMCATSTGLNLQFAVKVVFVELTFLSVHHTQAESRIHRIGQQKDVSVDYLLLDGTTDDMLWRSLVQKRATEKALFDESEIEDDDFIIPL